MLNIRKPRERTLGPRGTTISTTKDTIENNPVTDRSYDNPFMMNTPRSDGSALEPVPPKHLPKQQKNYVVCRLEATGGRVATERW